MKVLILSVEEAIAKNNSKYFRVRYVTDEKKEQSAVCFQSLEAGNIAGKICDISLKKGDMSDKIEDITPLDDKDFSPFIRKTPLDVEKALVEINEVVDKLCEPLNKIVKEVLKDPILTRFKTWPAAASVHHAFVGGLIEHTYSMLKLAEASKADIANKGIDYDVVLAAVIVHDIGKVAVYDFDMVSIKKNNLDTLIGHIVLSHELIAKVARENKIPASNEKVLNLRHCILAHHGKKEWGSPVMPATREAILVHQLDMIQSRCQIALEASVDLKTNERSPYNRALEAEIVKL